ncbi:hypothetical protein BJX63DRAFT_139802 [Aspergillus granulosus]|uniref:Uncharacterized protein n=1 Tax=Aspergillus granulosus TaxID=176169 RepID=A0ABR4GSM9_9EURO
MMFLCTARFDIESEQLAWVNEYLSTQEKQAENERKDAEKTKDEVFDFISDEGKILLCLKLFKPRNLLLYLSVSVYLGREELRLCSIVLSNWMIPMRFLYLIITIY